MRDLVEDELANRTLGHGAQRKAAADAQVRACQQATAEPGRHHLKQIDARDEIGDPRPARAGGAEGEAIGAGPAGQHIGAAAADDVVVAEAAGDGIGLGRPGQAGAQAAAGIGQHPAIQPGGGAEVDLEAAVQQRRTAGIAAAAVRHPGTRQPRRQHRPSGHGHQVGTVAQVGNAVVAGAHREQVGTAAPGQRVVADAAVQRVGLGAGGQHVVAGIAQQPVLARAAGQRVGRGRAGQRDPDEAAGIADGPAAGTARRADIHREACVQQGGGAGIAAGVARGPGPGHHGNHAGTGRDRQRVRAIAQVGDAVVAAADQEAVIPAAAGQRIVAAAAIQQVVGTAAIQLVAAAAAHHGVVAIAAGDAVGLLRADEAGAEAAVGIGHHPAAGAAGSAEVDREAIVQQGRRAGIAAARPSHPGAGQPRDQHILGADNQLVRAVAQVGNAVLPRAGDELVGTAAAIEGIVAGTAIQRVVAGAGQQHVVATIAAQRLGAVTALHIVIAVATQQRRGAAAHGDSVADRIALNDDVLQRQVDQVGMAGARQGDGGTRPGPDHGLQVGVEQRVRRNAGVGAQLQPFHLGQADALGDTAEPNHVEAIAADDGGPVAVGQEQVVAGAAIGLVAAKGQVQRVVAVAAEQLVEPKATHQPVLAATAREGVVAAEAVQRVVTGGADDVVGPPAAEVAVGVPQLQRAIHRDHLDRVQPAHGVDEHLAGAADLEDLHPAQHALAIDEVLHRVAIGSPGAEVQDIGAAGPGIPYQVGTGADDVAVATVATILRVVAVAADERVVALAAPQGIIADAADQAVRAAEAGDAVVALAAILDIGPPAAAQAVIAQPADQRVLVGADEGVVALQPIDHRAIAVAVLDPVGQDIAGHGHDRRQLVVGADAGEQQVLDIVRQRVVGEGAADDDLVLAAARRLLHHRIGGAQQVDVVAGAADQRIRAETGHQDVLGAGAGQHFRIGRQVLLVVEVRQVLVQRVLQLVPDRVEAAVHRQVVVLVRVGLDVVEFLAAILIPREAILRGPQ